MIIEPISVITIKKNILRKKCTQKRMNKLNTSIVDRRRNGRENAIERTKKNYTSRKTLTKK